MRVVHLHRIAGIGGSERHLLTLLPALRARGVDASFLGFDVRGSGPQPFYDELDAAGVPYRRVRPAGLPRALRTLRPDLVHTHLVHADVFGAVAAALARAPVVSTKHNDDPFRAGPFRHIERLLARRARRIVCITESVARYHRERVGLGAGKLRVVHYGLDELPPAWAGGSAGPELPPEVPVLLAVARLTAQKGLDVAIRALPSIRAEIPEAVLVVLGEGPDRPRLEELARTLGLADAVHLPGRAGDVAAWYRRAALLVHPARWEGFGLALLEAMLAGRAIVASGVSAIPELVVDGVTGLLVPPDDPDALAGATVAAYADRKRLGAAGLERARAEFSVERMVDRTLAVYAETT
jgi:glycosyltransferase involved in cell wall biosynthesis